jgi:hypothetical protein
MIFDSIHQSTQVVKESRAESVPRLQNSKYLGLTCRIGFLIFRPHSHLNAAFDLHRLAYALLTCLSIYLHTDCNEVFFVILFWG